MPNLKLGIVGLPNVGKSTLINALTGAAASAENYPFCRVDPKVGFVELPDRRLDLLFQKYRPRSRVPFPDIAGLVKGASEGEGLGNQFLANIREVDAIVRVVRCFDDPEATLAEGKPAREGRARAGAHAQRGQGLRRPGRRRHPVPVQRVASGDKDCGATIDTPRTQAEVRGVSTDRPVQRQRSPLSP